MTVWLDTLLTALHAGSDGVVRRAGRSYPAAVRAFGGPQVSLEDAVRLVGGVTEVDPELAAAGRRHLDALRAGGRVHDGEVLCLDRVGARSLTAVRGSYFQMLATCDAVRAELLAAGPEPAFPLRDRACAVAGDPTLSGRGRAAAVGVSVLLVVRLPDGERGVVLGRRSARVGTDPGRWHVAPSGMLEAAADGRHLATTVATELREELGVALDVEAVAASGVVLGVVTDLLRLRPDVAVRLDLDLLRPGVAVTDLVAGEEFDALDVVPLTPSGFADLWRRRPPQALTPAAAGALALLEDAAHAAPA